MLVTRDQEGPAIEMASTGVVRSARVLLVEDDTDLASVVAFTLDTAGMTVTVVADGGEALDVASGSTFDVVVLDLMLPTVDGFTICREVRARSSVPIVILTARDGTDDVVRGLEAGADDYVTKPFEAPELLARVRAALRRADTSSSTMLADHGVEVDVAGHRATVDGEPVELSATQFRLLVELMDHAGQVLDRDVLLRRVWDYDYLGDSRVVDMAIKRLRDRIEPDPGAPSRITTVRGVGYRFEGT